MAAKIKNVKLTAVQEEHLRSVLRQVWDTIAYDIAQVCDQQGEDFDKQKAVDVAECCVDYVGGGYGGTREDQNTLCRIGTNAFRQLAKKTFPEFK